MGTPSKTRLWALRLPKDASRGARLLHGFLLPLIVLQALLQNADDRRRYLRITVTQAVITLLCAILLVPVYRYLTEVYQTVEREAEVAVQQTLGVMQEKIATAVESPQPSDNRDQVVVALNESATRFRSELDAIAVAPRPEVGRRPPLPPPPPLPDLDTQRELFEEARELEQSARELQREAAQLQREGGQVAREVAQAQAEVMREHAQALGQLGRQRGELRRRLSTETDPEARAALEAEARELEQELDAAQREMQQEVAAAQSELQQALGESQEEIRRGVEELTRSADSLARQAAARAAEAMRVRVELQPPPPPALALAGLEQRLEAGFADSAPPEQVERAMQAAVEASFVAERSREAARAVRQQLRRPGLSAQERERLEDQLEELEEQAEEARALAREARAEAKSALRQVALVDPSAQGRGDETQRRVAAALGQVAPEAQFLVYLAALYAALYVVQFIVIALTREHHDLLSRRASLATRIEPEDPDLTPRVHIDWKWMRTRLWRRYRALKLFAFGLPLIYLVTWWLPGGEGLRTLLISVWGAYWFAVHVAGKSARAWVDEGLARDPWFLRGPGRLAQRVPLLGRAPFNLYGRLFRRHGGEVFAPAECVERQPWDFAGLTVFRFLASFPLVKLFLRPFAPVAAAHLLESYRAERPARSAQLATALGNRVPNASPA